MRTHVVRLEPPIPVSILARAAGDRSWPAGRALAYAWVECGVDHDVYWRVCFAESREFWDVPNPYVRGTTNIAMGRP